MSPSTTTTTEDGVLTEIRAGLHEPTQSGNDNIKAGAGWSQHGSFGGTWWPNAELQEVDPGSTRTSCPDLCPWRIYFFNSIMISSSVNQYFTSLLADEDEPDELRSSATQIYTPADRVINTPALHRDL